MLPCPSQSPGACSNSWPRSWWCYVTISSSDVTFSFRLQSFPASGSFPMSWLFSSGGQSIGVSASASVLSMNIQGWFPLELTGLILQSKGLSRIFPSTTFQKHQFFSAQPSLWSNSHICTWLLEKPYLWLDGPLSAVAVSYSIPTMGSCRNCYGSLLYRLKSWHSKIFVTCARLLSW